MRYGILAVALVLGLPWGVGAQNTTAPAAADTVSGKPLTAAGRERAAEACTQAPRSEWISEDEMRLLAQHRGYRIKTFKIANGNCYEIYGFTRDRQIVEAYFDPVTTRLVRQNLAR